MCVNKICFVISIAIALTGCQAGAQTRASMKNSSGSLQNTVTTDNSKKELTTTISPQIAKTIQNYQSAMQVSQDDSHAFDPKKVYIVVNDSFLSPNGTFPPTKNVVRIVKDGEQVPFVIKIMNGNSGEGATLEDTSFAVISQTLRLLGWNGELSDAWFDMRSIHPTDIAQVPPSSFDARLSVLNSTGSYSASIRLVSKDKPEIVRDFIVLIESHGNSTE